MPTIEQAQKWYEGADPVHDFDHVSRVYRMAERLAKVEGADLEIVRAAALLHDAEGSSPDDASARMAHHEASAAFAGEVLKEEDWSQERIEAVQHCIRAHRYRSTEEPETIEAKVLFDSDKLDVLGAFGVARTIGYAALAGQPSYVEPSEQFLSTGEKEEGEPHSSYHEFIFKLSKVKDRLYTESAKKLAQQRHQFIVDFYEQLAAEQRGEL
ncbi:MAG: HD domain-containing protein [Chloroflexi bacterium]|nr:MAG: HD domain-containing protein [Chloroflexota bacterium]MBL1197470.1 HD domain-containing protein [Chloroflexota bacterium]NOH14765.1 HD domain-containing protein [Chloroflexota bacterium]